MNEPPRDPRVTALPRRATQPDATPGKDIPAGMIDMVITYLEMTARPSRPHAPAPAGQLALMRADPPTVSFYRYLYDTVGEPWLWHERREMDDSTLAAIITDPAVEVYVLYVSGVPAGYSELDRRVPGETELAYFGLLPEFTGRGLGPYLLDWSVDRAWAHDTRRVWVHTCNRDHPGAMATYQRGGFTPYRQETVFIKNPGMP